MWSPFHRNEQPADIVRSEEAHPLQVLRHRMDQLFDDFTAGYGWPFTDGRGARSLRVDVGESESELTVDVELPGVDEKDLDISLADEVLTIKGEKKKEKEEKNKDYHLTERSYGSFHRTMRLPFEPDPKKVKAKFKAGVLTITMPKPPEAKSKVKKIAIGNSK